MKQCPNCFTSCSDSEQFCPACGTWLQNSAPSAGLNPGGPGNPSLYGKKKSRKKIWIIVLCTVLILCTAGGTGFFVWNKIQNDRIQERKARYAENIESGERYLLDQNYERAETAFLEPKGKQSNLTASPLTKGLPSSPYSMSHVISVLSSEYHDVTTSPSSVR